MPVDDEKIWSAVAAGAAVGATVATKPVVERLYRAVTRREPPGNPAHADVTWGDALLWALFTGALVGVIRLVAQRAAAEGWRVATGDHPKALRSTRP